MMGNDGSMDWAKKPEWYGVDENKKLCLTNKAPPEARESFQKWMDFQEEVKRNGTYR